MKQFGAPGPQKSINSIEKTMVFEEIPFSARVVSWTRFWTLLASLLGAFWPPRWLKPVLEFLLERPRAIQEYFFRARERPKSRPRAKRPPRGPQGQFGSHVGTILERFGNPLEAMLPPCWSRFLAEASFAKGPRSQVPGPAECA